MTKFIDVILWIIFTFIIAITMYIEYNDNRIKELAVEYRCYAHMNLKDGWYDGDTTPTYTRGTLLNLSTGDTFNNFIVSKIESTSSSVSVHFDPTDNPALNKSVINCYK